jgi:hypothetical protein
MDSDQTADKLRQSTKACLYLGATTIHLRSSTIFEVPGNGGPLLSRVSDKKNQKHGH